MVTNREDIPAEPESNFPLGFYEHFLSEIRRRGIVTVTYDDLFATSHDFDHEKHFPHEFKNWINQRDPTATYLLIQHDIDNHPAFTRRMAEMEIDFGIQTNIFMFVNRASFTDSHLLYEVEHEFFVDAEKRGFVIGYHQNALSLAQNSWETATARYLDDVLELRRMYGIHYVVPHGGRGVVVDGALRHNVDLPIPLELRDSLRWVYNRYGVKFHNRWSDGGLRKVRDRGRLEKLDLVGSFLDSLKPGTRNFCLVHPQRWGINVNPRANPMLEKMPWYQRVCRDFS